jgi:hypothetical protein
MCDLFVRYADTWRARRWRSPRRLLALLPVSLFEDDAAIGNN